MNGMTRVYFLKSSADEVITSHIPLHYLAGAGIKTKVSNFYKHKKESNIETDGQPSLRKH